MRKKWMIVLGVATIGTALAFVILRQDETQAVIGPANAAYRPVEQPGTENTTIETAPIVPSDGCCSDFIWWPLTGDGSN